MNAWLVNQSGRWHVLYDWTAALSLLVLGWLLSLWMFWPSVQSISHIWFNSETYAHGVIIFPLALFLAWTRRHDLIQERPQPSAWGLFWLAIAGMAWVLARSVDVELIQHFALVALLPGLVLTLLGTGIARLLVFPLAYLFFAVPFGDFIVPLLQEYTAWFTVWMLKLSGLPVYKEGYYISIPAGDFVVAEVCSGVRYLIASIALGLIFAYISYRSLWRRTALVALAVLLPITANGVRAYGIIMIAHWTNMEHAVGVDHLIYGWLFFGLVMLLLFWLGSLWREKTVTDPGEHTKSATATSLNPGFVIIVLSALTVVLMAPRGGEWLLQHQARQVVNENTPTLPVEVSGWSSEQLSMPSWHPHYFDADAQLARVYQHDGERVELHLYQYLNRGTGTEIASWRNQIYDGETWRRIAERKQQIVMPNGERLVVHETVMRGPGGVPRLVWHWYQVGGVRSIQEVEVKLREALALLIGDGRGAFLVAVSAEQVDSLDNTREQLAQFVKALPQPLGQSNE